MKCEMTEEDACEQIGDAQKLLSIAYKLLLEVEKRCSKKCSYPLSDVLIDLGKANLALSVIEDEYAGDVL